MEDIKYCPIGSINCPDYVPCLREACAWCIRGRCAVAIIAESMEDAASRLFDIAANGGT